MYACITCIFQSQSMSCKQSALSYVTKGFSKLLPPSQIISHSKNFGESKHLNFDQNYRKNYKDLWHQMIYYENILNEDPNDT
jgi:hypothetical protein